MEIRGLLHGQLAPDGHVSALKTCLLDPDSTSDEQDLADGHRVALLRRPDEASTDPDKQAFADHVGLAPKLLYLRRWGMLDCQLKIWPLKMIIRGSLHFRGFWRRGDGVASCGIQTGEMHVEPLSREKLLYASVEASFCRLSTYLTAILISRSQISSRKIRI